VLEGGGRDCVRTTWKLLLRLVSIIVSYDHNFVGAKIIIKSQLLVLNIEVTLCLYIEYVMNLGWLQHCIPVFILVRLNRTQTLRQRV